MVFAHKTRNCTSKLLTASSRKKAPRFCFMILSWTLQILCIEIFQWVVKNTLWAKKKKKPLSAPMLTVLTVPLIKLIQVGVIFTCKLVCFGSIQLWEGWPELILRVSCTGAIKLNYLHCSSSDISRDHSMRFLQQCSLLKLVRTWSLVRFALVFGGLFHHRGCVPQAIWLHSEDAVRLRFKIILVRGPFWGILFTVWCGSWSHKKIRHLQTNNNKKLKES